MTGQPCVVVRVGATAGGLPIGVQIVARILAARMWRWRWAGCWSRNVGAGGGHPSDKVTRKKL